MKKTTWTEDEIKILEEEYSKYSSTKDIVECLPNKSISAILSKASKLGLTRKYIRKNNANYKAIYKDYDWFFDRYITKNMTLQEMADEANVTLRVIEKWADEKHHINKHTYKALKKLSDLQKEIITVGIIGDGHIDKRIDQPMYIESHSIDEKDYIFWKYEILKDLCNKEPVYYPESYVDFSGNKHYLCNPYYRINTKIICELAEIRDKSHIEIIQGLTELQVCLLFLDDGSRNDAWELCVAEWDIDEINELIYVLDVKYRLRLRKKKDIRYVTLDAISSKRLDEYILKNIPNDLDIVHKKILNNSNIKHFQNSIYIIKNDSKIGLNSYCRKNGIPYLKNRDLLRTMNLKYNEIEETEFKKIMKVV